MARTNLATFSPVLALAAALTLGACDLRRDGSDDSAGDDTIVETTPTPAAGTSPEVSIMRDDLEQDEVIELPVRPIALTIPFPESAELGPGAERLLAGIMDEKALDELWPVVLAGHTDSGGNDQANLRASRARAEAVAAWLVERGVADDRIEVIAFGEQNPIAPNALPDGSPNEEGRRRNRRVELRVGPPAAGAPEELESDEGA